jgi:hypothetical protein
MNCFPIRLASGACSRRVLTGAAIVAGCLVWSNVFAARAAAEPAHPAMHHALFELQEAKSELKKAAHDFGGHREKSLLAVDAAIKQLELALEAKGDAYKGPKGRDVKIYKEYANYPHIRHSVHELKKARIELVEAKHDFGGHREKAVKDVDYAIKQLELAIGFAKK